MNKRKNSIDGFTQRPRKKVGDFDSIKPVPKKTKSVEPANKPVGIDESNLDIHSKIEGTRPDQKESEHTVKSRKARRKAKKMAKKQKRAAQPKAWRVTKRFIIVGALSVALLGGVIAFRSWIALQQIIDRGGDGAIALDENIDPNQLRGEGDGRINIMLIGIGGEKHQAGNLADSIIVASIDPFAKEMGLLSVPRDLYVDIPTVGMDKINAAHAHGEDRKYPGGGIRLMEHTLEKTLDIPIHYYVRVDFDGFTQAIDTVGGVTVTLDEPVWDPNFDWQFGVDALNLPAGDNNLDGQTALLLSRARGATGVGLGVSRGDFGRSERQRDILVALKDKIFSIGTFANPAKVASLISTAGSHLRTNLQISEILRVYEITQEIPQKNIVSFGLDNSADNYLTSSVSPVGASIQVPKTGNFKEIQLFVREIFVDGFIKMEEPSVDVLNGSGQNGLAGKTARELATFGYIVNNTGKSPAGEIPTTIMYDLSDGKKPYTKQLLKNRLNAEVLPGRQLPKSISTNSDFVIILGVNET